jgi:hypothetical protein
MPNRPATQLAAIGHGAVEVVAGQPLPVSMNWFPLNGCSIFCPSLRDKLYFVIMPGRRLNNRNLCKRRVSERVGEG